MSKVKNLRGFMSWIVFALFPNSEVAWAALAGLGITVVLLAVDRRGGIPLDALVLDVSTVVFFAALAVAALTAPHAPLGTWSGALSFGWLGSPPGGVSRSLGRSRWVWPAAVCRANSSNRSRSSGRKPRSPGCGRSSSPSSRRCWWCAMPPI